MNVGFSTILNYSPQHLLYSNASTIESFFLIQPIHQMGNSPGAQSAATVRPPTRRYPQSASSSSSVNSVATDATWKTAQSIELSEMSPLSVMGAHITPSAPSSSVEIIQPQYTLHVLSFVRVLLFNLS